MASDPLFRMTIDDVFSIRDRGTVVTGQVESGSLNLGDEIYINHQGMSKKVVVTGIEAFRKTMQQANAGDHIGVLLRDIDRREIQHGDILTGSGFDFR